MKKGLLPFTILFFLVVFFAACKKNNDTVPAAPQKTMLSKADYSAVGTYTYTYDNSNKLLAEMYSGNASNPSAVTTFTNFDARGRVTEFLTDYGPATYTDYKTVVSYNSDGKVERKQTYDLSGNNAGYNYFQYTAGKITVKQYSASNAVSFSTEYTFSVDGLNIITSKSFNSTGTLTSTTNYSNFDAKHSTDSLLPYGYIDIPFNKNNWQSLSRTNNLSGTVTAFTVAYDYNADDYPVKRTASSGSTIAYDYFKK